MSGEPAGYVGRFAPSPTGPLHFGSLLSAVASYAESRVRGGSWLVRIEDIDPPREQAGSDKLILDALEAYGFEWDGPVTYQSQFTARHEELVDGLLDSGDAYPCSCSRRDLADAPRGPLGVIYPGTCRRGCLSEDVAIRLRTNSEAVEFTDTLQGRISQRLEPESGDFIIRRRDGLIAYHLAVVVDDYDQGITEIVRGIDLLDSTPRQIWLQRVLGFDTPTYTHVPIAVNEQGQKLSKLTGAEAIEPATAGPTLVKALKAFGLEPGDSLQRESPARIWQWALERWDVKRLTGIKEIPAGSFGFG